MIARDFLKICNRFATDLEKTCKIYVKDLQKMPRDLQKIDNRFTEEIQYKKLFEKKYVEIT